MDNLTYMKVTALKDGVLVNESKYIQVEETTRGYESRDQNNNGYYHVPHAGKIGFLQLITEPTLPKAARKTAHTDSDILGMWKPEQANAVLWTKQGGIVYALCEVLSTSERVNTMIQRSIDRNKK